MKVIKKGRQQTGWSKESTCTGKGNGDGGCGAVLLVESTDLFKTFRFIKDETDTFISFKCSECGVITDIHNSLEGGMPSQFSDIPSQAEWNKIKQPGYCKE